MLIAKCSNCRQCIVNVTQRFEHGSLVVQSRLFDALALGLLRGLELTGVEDGRKDVAEEAPGHSVAAQEIRQILTGRAIVPRQGKGRQSLGSRNTHPSRLGGELLFGFDHVGSSRQQLHGQSRRYVHGQGLSLERCATTYLAWARARQHAQRILGLSHQSIECSDRRLCVRRLDVCLVDIELRHDASIESSGNDAQRLFAGHHRPL